MATKNTSSHDLLRRYLSGAITAPEEAELERLAREDEVLAEAMQGLRSAPEEDHTARIRNMVRKAQKGNRSAEATIVSTRPHRYRWAAAAAILLLLASSLFFLPQFLDQQNSEDLAMETRQEPAPASADQPMATGSPESELADNAPESPEEKSSPSAAVTTRNDASEDPTPEVNPENNQSTPPPPAPTPPEASSAPTQAATKPTPPVPAPEQEDVISEEVQEPPVVSRPEASAAAPTTIDREITTPASISPPAALAKRQSADQMKDSMAGNGAPAGNGLFLDGRITNENGYPITNALVRLPGLPLGERTDSNGLFKLPADAATNALVVSHPDYETENVEVSTLKEKLQISLERKPFQPADDRPRWLQDVARSRIVFDNRPGYASPLEGYNTLRKRIEANRPADVPTGKVKLSFLVNPDGTLSDFQFRGRPSQATMDYIGGTLVTSSVWEVERGDEPVRVYFKVVFE